MSWPRYILDEFELGAIDRLAVRTMRALGLPKDLPGAACRPEETPLVVDEDGELSPIVPTEDAR